MISVLHLTSSFGLGGGAETNLARLVCNIESARFRSTVVTMTNVPTRDYDVLRLRLAPAGVGMYSLGMRSGVPDPLGAARLYRIIRQVRPHIVQTWMYHADLLGLLIGKLTNVPSILWSLQCSNLPDDVRMSMLVRRALVPLSPFPQLVIVNSYSGLRFHEELGYRPRSWLHIPNSLDLDEFRPDPEARSWLRSQLELTPGARLIGLIARFHPVKDHRTFIEAAKLLAAKDANIHFVLVGGGVDANNVNVMQLIESTGFAERFHPLGHRIDINRIAAALDVACSSSTSEGTSNVICEAMACGIPCVVTDVGDSSLIVGDAGEVVPAQCPTALARACWDLLSMSPDQQRKIGLVARKRIQESFSLRSVIDRYQELYEQQATNSSGFAARRENDARPAYFGGS